MILNKELDMKILILGDIHGRDFWIEPCSHIDEFDKVIFLGDYHDPYPYQVSQDTSRHRLRDELVPFVLKNKDKCICLYGNHDGYVVDNITANRYDVYHHNEIKKYLQQLDLKLIYKIDNYLFSHSGVLPKWLKLYNLTLEDLETLPLNHSSLNEVSFYRGGFDVGSCIWGDIREYRLAEKIPNVYQIFGHTQLEMEVIKPEYACLDCKKAFVLNTETGDISEYGNKDSL